jgi:hypothetical protein
VEAFLSKELLVRFLAGGIVVSLFSVLGDVLEPKSFAGLFGAAPSVALATLILTVHKNGVSYAQIEARSMIAGGVAFLIYAWTVSRLLRLGIYRVLPTTAGFLAGWLASALVIWSVALR